MVDIWKWLQTQVKRSVPINSFRMLKLQPFYIAANKANEYSFLSVSKLKKYFNSGRYNEITKNEITSILGGTLHFLFFFALFLWFEISFYRFRLWFSQWRFSNEENRLHDCMKALRLHEWVIFSWFFFISGEGNIYRKS